MTIRAAIANLLKHTDWNMPGIAFILHVPVEKVREVHKDLQDAKKKGHDKEELDGR